MFPLLMIIGLFAVGFVGTFVAKGAASAIGNSNKKSEKSKSNDESNKQDRNKKNNNQQNEVSTKNQNNSKEELIASIKELIETISSTKKNTNYSKLVDKKIANMDMDNKENIDKNCRNKVASAIRRKWEANVDQVADQANNLIKDIQNGANLEEASKNIPSLPSVENFVNDSDELINDTISKYNYYNLYIEARDNKREEMLDNNLDVQIDDISNYLEDKIDDPSVGVEEFENLVQEGIEKLVIEKAEDVQDEIEENQDEFHFDDIIFNDEEIDEKVNKDDKKENALNLIKEYRDYINSGKNEKNLSIKEIIEEKVSNIKLNPNNDKSKELVAKALESSWNHIVNAVNSKVDSMLEEADKENIDLERVTERMPKVNYAWFDSKGADKVVEKTMIKANLYFNAVEDISSILNKFKDNDDSNVVKSKLFVVQIMKNIEKKIVSAEISPTMFEIDLERDILIIKDAVNDMGRNQYFTSIMRDIVNLKAKNDSLNDKIEVYADKLKSLSDMELNEMKETIEELLENDKINRSQIENLWKALAKEMSNRSQQDIEIKAEIKENLLKVREALSKKANIEVVNDNLKKISNKCKILSTSELKKLSDVVKKLQESLDGVEERFKKVVEKELDGLEDNLREFLKKSLAIRIGKKMKEFESKQEKEKEKIIDDIVKKLEETPVKLTDEDVDKIVDSVINNMTISRK